MIVKEEDFLNWKSDPVTEAFFEWMKGQIEGRKNEWVRAVFSAPGFEQTVIQNATAIGFCNAYVEAIELTFDQLTEPGDE